MVKFMEEDVHYTSIKAFLSDIRATEHIAPESHARSEMTTNGISGKETRIQSDKTETATVIEDGLATLKFADMHYREDHITIAQGGSYAWLSDPAVGLRSWLLSDDRIYWIRGKPGSGKSTLMKYLSQNLETIVGNDHSTQCEYLWFFFNARGSYLQKSFEGLLRSVLYQLGKGNPSIEQIIVDRCKTKEPGMRNIWTDTDLVSIFELVREQITIERPVVLFLDALDEFNGYPETIADFLSSLSSLSSSTGQQKTLDIKICFSSRPWDVFVERFDKCCGIRLQDWTRADISRYADVRLQKILDPAPLDPISESTQSHLERMVNYIHENAQGVFLWVTLVLDELTKLSHMSPHSLYAEMTKFPADLEDYYRFTLGRIPPKDKSDAFILLELVLRNKRLWLDLRLLYCAFKCAKGTTFETCQQLLRVAYYEPQDESHMATKLKDLCGGLLEVVPVDLIEVRHDPGIKFVVQFMHETAKAFVHRPGWRQYLACNSGLALEWTNGHHFWTKYWFASAISFSRDKYIGQLLSTHSCLAEYTVGNHFGTFLDTVPESFFDCQRSECFQNYQIWIDSRLSFAAVSGLQLYISQKLADKAKECSDGPALLLNNGQTSPLAHMICAEIIRRCLLCSSNRTSLFHFHPYELDDDPSSLDASSLDASSLDASSLDASSLDASLLDVSWLDSVLATLQTLIGHGLRLNTLVNGGSPLEHFFHDREHGRVHREESFRSEGSGKLLTTVLDILLSAGCSPETALMDRSYPLAKTLNRCACRPLHAVRDARLTRVLLDHGADPDSLDEEGHTPLDKRVALLPHIIIRDQHVKILSTKMLGLFDSASPLVEAGGHLSQDGYKDFLRRRKRWLRDWEPMPGSPSPSSEDVAKFMALMGTVPVLQNRPTRRQLRAMYRKSSPLSTYADLASSPNESVKPKSSSLRGLFRRLKT
ncbi:hypothetical protein LTR67_006915 [Exophiala xenobiotica]